VSRLTFLCSGSLLTERLRDFLLAAHGTLRLTIRYRTLVEELRHNLSVLARPTLESRGLAALEPWFVDTLSACIDSDPAWSDIFFAHGTVDVPEVELTDLRRWSGSLGLDAEAFRPVVEAWEEVVDVRLARARYAVVVRRLTLTLPAQALDDFVAPMEGPSDLPWRTLQIPVDVPVRQVRPSRSASCTLASSDCDPCL
jgi:hypothetical protein